jgi:hypothetical protein
MSNLGNMASPFIVTIAEKINVQSMLVGGIVCLAGAASMLLSKETLVTEPTKDERQVSITSEEPLLRESTLQAN